MNETTTTIIEATETTTEATNNTAVNTETTVAADPATSVAAEAPANGNFLSAHKGTIIKAGIGVAVAAGSALIVRHVMKKHGQPSTKKGFKLPFFNKKDAEVDQTIADSEAVLNGLVNAVNNLGATVDAQVKNQTQGQVIDAQVIEEPQAEATETTDNAQA